MAAAASVAADAGQFALKRHVRALVQGGEFDELDFLRQTSRQPCSELLKALQAASDELQDEITVQVNEEFEGFVRLFDEIGNVGEEEFAGFGDKVRAIREHVGAVCDRSRGELALVEGALGRLQDNLADQMRVSFAAQLSQSLERVERLLDQGGGGGGSSDLQIAAEIFHRVNSEVQHTSGLILLPEEMLRRLASVADAFFSLLDDTLTATLRQQDASAWTTIASIYVKFAKFQPLEEAFAEEVWKRQCAQVRQPQACRQITLKIVSRQRIDELRALHGAAALPLFFSELYQALSAVKTRWFDVLKSSRASYKSPFVSAVLAPTLTQITKELPSIFSPALPDAFHTNYVASSAFIERLLAILDEREAEVLIQSPAFESYNRSWQLNVYFQLRFRDVAQHLEDQLLPPARTADLFASRDDLEVPETFERYAALAALQQACLTISSPKTLLAPLAPKFFRLLIQTVSRPSRWLTETIKEAPPAGGSLSLSKCWIAAWNHQELVGLARRLLHDEGAARMTKELDPAAVATLIRRLEEELDDRQAQQNQKIQDVLRDWTLLRVKEMDTDCRSPLYIFWPFQRLLLLEQRLPAAAGLADAWKVCVLSFVARTRELVAQSHRAVSNHRRLKSIMKKQVAEDVADGEDREAQHALFLETMQGEAQYTIQIGGSLGVGEDAVEMEQLRSLLEEQERGNAGTR